MDERRKRLALLARILGSTVVAIDGSVVTVAPPAIREDLGGGLAGQQWASNAYLLTLGSLLLLGGSLGDAYGQRRIFALGLVGFGVTSVVCAAAPTIGILIAGQALQGVLQRACEWGRIPSNPVVAVRKPPVGERALSCRIHRLNHQHRRGVSEPYLEVYALSVVKRTNINLDMDLVDQAAHELGTQRTTDTVHQALREVIGRAHRARLAQRDFEDLTPEAVEAMRRPADRAA